MFEPGSVIVRNGNSTDYLGMDQGVMYGNEGMSGYSDLVGLYRKI